MIKADDSETDPEMDSDKVPMEVCNEVRATNLLIDDKDKTHPENSQHVKLMSEWSESDLDEYESMPRLDKQCNIEDDRDGLSVRVCDPTTQSYS